MVEQSLVDVSAGTVPGMTTLPHLHEFSVTGPTNVSGDFRNSQPPQDFRLPSGRRQAMKFPAPRRSWRRLARQAYRRPITDNDLEELLELLPERPQRRDFESGIRTALQAMIASPEFVFRFEQTPASAAPGSNFRISDLELASRLSYFLWSSAPDEQLIALASQGKLQEPAVLEKQVRRMLADPRSEALTTNFAGAVAASAESEGT